MSQALPVKASPVDAIAPLFVPADRPERYAKAAASGADSVIIDLEDAIAIAGKDDARKTLVASPRPPKSIVRINASGTKWHADDLAAVKQIAPTAIILPKAESADQIEGVRKAIGDLPVIALIESAYGIAHVRAIALKVQRLAFGYIDYSADLGCSMEEDALLFARSEIVLASRLANLPSPLDGVTPSFNDAGLIETESRYSASLGFGGKMCIHPKQIAPTFAGFRPPQDEIDWARRVTATGDGAASLDGQMIDAPVRLRAARILARATACDDAMRITA